MLNKKEKILIVDDNTQNLQYLGSILLEERYQIIAANNGKKALELAEQQVPDLILLDIMMPEMDGFETSQKLKENHKTNQIPI
ncbi:MAG: response regulator, partial [Leptospiraceae bacterium]|nr:response regulator [Leptospiraceae bacterium]